jgi:hypothetical protein
MTDTSRPGVPVRPDRQGPQQIADRTSEKDKTYKSKMTVEGDDLDVEGCISFVCSRGRPVFLRENSESAHVRKIAVVGHQCIGVDGQRTR